MWSWSGPALPGWSVPSSRRSAVSACSSSRNPRSSATRARCRGARVGARQPSWPGRGGAGQPGGGARLFAQPKTLPRNGYAICKARYPKTSGLISKLAPFGCYQAASPAHQSRIPIRSVLLLGIGGAVGSTKPAAAMRARTGQGRDRLPSCPHPVWSSIQFATGCRSDRGSRRSCHTPLR